MSLVCGSIKVIVTENANIEVKNLNKLFFFRLDNFVYFKSKTACEITKGMNNSLNI